MSNTTSLIAKHELGPASKVSLTLDRNVAVVESPFARTAQRQVRGGARWRATLDYDPYTGEEVDEMVAWMDRVSRGDALVSLDSDANVEGGTFVATELGSPWTTGTGGWTSTRSSLTVVENQALVRAQNDAASCFISRTYTVVAGAPYFISVDAVSIGAGTSAGAYMQILDGSAAPIRSAVVAPGDQRLAAFVTPLSTSLTVRLYPSASSVQIVDAVAAFGMVSVQRCLSSRLADGALVLEDPAGSLTGVAMRRGQMFSVLTTAGWELKRLTSHAITRPARAPNPANIMPAFEPALRGDIVAGNPVLIGKPFACFRLAQARSIAEYGAARSTGFSMEFVEHLERGNAVMSGAVRSEGMSLWLDFAAQDYRIGPAADALKPLESLPS